MLQKLEVETWMKQRRSNLDDAKKSAAEIITLVRNEGDRALLQMAKKYEPDIDSIRISPEEIDAAYDEVDDSLVESIVEAEMRITRFHERQKDHDLWLEEVEPGITLGVKTTPLDRVGFYIPGRRAAYPSTALMNAIPAKVAGVPDVCACSPPPILPLTLVALDIVGVEEIYRMGGAQAIAAMSLGTETIKPVRKIVGPGNAYVTAAKRQVYGEVALDLVAGPSEIMIIADTSADPSFIAADMLSQAEHGSGREQAVLLSTSADLLPAVRKELLRQSKLLSRSECIEKVLQNGVFLVQVKDLAEAAELASLYAPEHLELIVENPRELAPKITAAGAIFLGPWTPEPVGDFVAGPSHVLPTGGSARFFTGLTVEMFFRRSSLVEYDRSALERELPAVTCFAKNEGLDAHGNSAAIRFQ